MSDIDPNEDGGGVKDALNRMQDAVGGMVGMASAGTLGAHSAPAFVANAAIGDLYEIEAGALALRKARSDEVRTMAATMVEHHTTSSHQLKSALRSSEVAGAVPDLQPPAELDARRQGMIRHLQEATEDDFDDRYLEQQLMAHQETLTLLKGYGDHGDNPQLQSFARGGAPMVERHLKMIQAMRA